MAGGDFIHRGLIKAGSKDAVNNMLAGAAVGAVANIGLNAVQGDFSIVSNGTSGALLGAAGGAAARHVGAKYVDGLRQMERGGEYTSKFKTSVFTEAEKMEESRRQDFMGGNKNFGKFNHEDYAKKSTPKTGNTSSNTSSTTNNTSQGAGATNSSTANTTSTTAEQAGSGVASGAEVKAKSMFGGALDGIKNIVDEKVSNSIPNTNLPDIKEMSSITNSEARNSRIGRLQNRADALEKAEENNNSIGSNVEKIEPNKGVSNPLSNNVIPFSRSGNQPVDMGKELQGAEAAKRKSFKLYTTNPADRNVIPFQRNSGQPKDMEGAIQGAHDAISNFTPLKTTNPNPRQPS